MIRNWSKERLEAGIAETRERIAALDAYLEEDWSGSETEKQVTLRKYKAALDNSLKNMEHVLEEKKLA